METILAWTLIIAALAILSMLAFLFVSEREVKRKKIEIESLRAQLEGAVPAVEARPNLLADGGAGVATEVAALTEQVRSNEVTIATMQCELEALRAENSWLKRQPSRCAANSGDAEPPVAESLPSPQTEQSAATASALVQWCSGASDRPSADPNYSLDLGPRKNRLMAPVVAVALLLVALISVYFARTQKTPREAGLQAEAFTENSDQPRLTRAGAITAEEELKNTRTDGNPTAKTSTAKKRLPSGASYEVVRSTRVFSQPNESSRPLARIEAGMEINVIGARDGWLEVRSRHGRPPGFIRKDAAVIKASDRRQ